MLVGFVSDENYAALSDVQVVFENDRGLTPARSLANGAILADIAAGPCRAVLAHPGYGSKTVEFEADSDRPFQFRLLADRLLGYVWPKWQRSGEPAEFRVHSVEPY